jgi:hypothetical protein
MLATQLFIWLSVFWGSPPAANFFQGWNFFRPSQQKNFGNHWLHSVQFVIWSQTGILSSNVENERTNMPVSFPNFSYWEQIVSFFSRSAPLGQIERISFNKTNLGKNSFFVSFLLDFGTYVECLGNVYSFTVFTLLILGHALWTEKCLFSWKVTFYAHSCNLCYSWTLVLWNYVIALAGNRTGEARILKFLSFFGSAESSLQDLTTCGRDQHLGQRRCTPDIQYHQYFYSHRDKNVPLVYVGM